MEGLHDVFEVKDVEAFASVITTAGDAKSFATRTPESKEKCREALESAYRITFENLQHVSGHSSAVAAQAPATLVTQNFHVEQIWAQVDMLHSAGMKRVKYAIFLPFSCVCTAHVLLARQLVNCPLSYAESS